MKSYDIVIVGAGIAGSSLAYFAKKMGKKVLLIDRASTVATGGSGAAGAFISPKLGSSTPLLRLTNRAFNFAINFYSKNFPNNFNQTGLIRLSKDEIDSQKFIEYQKSIGGELLSPNELNSLEIKSEFNGLFFKDAGDCNAQELCSLLVKGVDFLQMELKELEFNGKIKINQKIESKNLILATGYEGGKELEYMGIKGLWGSRGDFYSSSKIRYSIHKKISISSDRDGVIKIGATHIKAKSPTQACLQCDGDPLRPLIKEANEMRELEGLKLKELFCGMRSGSRDFIPTSGKVIDSKYMLKMYPNIKNGFKRVEFKYIDGLYTLNGLGGRGFVLAPMLAKNLINHIFSGESLIEESNPDRLFLKWARKLK